MVNIPNLFLKLTPIDYWARLWPPLMAFQGPGPGYLKYHLYFWAVGRESTDLPQEPAQGCRQGLHKGLHKLQRLFTLLTLLNRHGSWCVKGMETKCLSAHSSGKRVGVLWHKRRTNLPSCYCTWTECAFGLRCPVYQGEEIRVLAIDWT